MTKKEKYRLLELLNKFYDEQAEHKEIEELFGVAETIMLVTEDIYEEK